MASNTPTPNPDWNKPKKVDMPLSKLNLEAQGTPLPTPTPEEQELERILWQINPEQVDMTIEEAIMELLAWHNAELTKAREEAKIHYRGEINQEFVSIMADNPGLDRQVVKSAIWIMNGRMHAKEQDALKKLAPHPIQEDKHEPHL